MSLVKWKAKWAVSFLLAYLILTVLSGCGAVPEKKAGKESEFKETDAVSVNRLQYEKLSPEAKRNFDQAIVDIQKGNNSSAENRLKKLMKENPDFLSAPVNLGILYYKTGRIPSAEGILKSVVKADAKNIIAYNYLGILYRQEGKFQEAESAYKKAISIDSGYANAYLNLGILYDLYLQNYPAALENYKHFQALVIKDKGEEDKEVKKWIFDLKGRMK